MIDRISIGIVMLAWIVPLALSAEDRSLPEGFTRLEAYQSCGPAAVYFCMLKRKPGVTLEAAAKAVKVDKKGNSNLYDISKAVEGYGFKTTVFKGEAKDLIGKGADKDWILALKSFSSDQPKFHFVYAWYDSKAKNICLADPDRGASISRVTEAEFDAAFGGYAILIAR